MLFSLPFIRFATANATIDGCDEFEFLGEQTNSKKYEIPVNGTVCLEGPYLIAGLSNYTVAAKFSTDQKSYRDVINYDNPFIINLKVNFAQLQAQDPLNPLTKVECKDKTQTCKIQIVPLIPNLEAKGPDTFDGIPANMNYISSSVFSTKKAFTMELPAKLKVDAELQGDDQPPKSMTCNGNVKALYMMGNSLKNVTYTISDAQYSFPIIADSNETRASPVNAKSVFFISTPISIINYTKTKMKSNARKSQKRMTVEIDSTITVTVQPAAESSADGEDQVSYFKENKEYDLTGKGTGAQTEEQAANNEAIDLDADPNAPKEDPKEYPKEYPKEDPKEDPKGETKEESKQKEGSGGLSGGAISGIVIAVIAVIVIIVILVWCFVCRGNGAKGKVTFSGKNEDSGSGVNV